MGIKIGDRVAVIDDVFEGKVMAIDNEVITVESTDGFIFQFGPTDLVVLGENQDELSKFSDIANDSLYYKDADQNKEKPTFSIREQREMANTVMEVDLHIEQLASNMKNLDAYDILNIQMDTAKHKLEYAIRNRIPRIVFIHGKGNGVLQKELEFLFKNYHVSASSADFKKYGIGATEVYVYQNRKR